ncbi:hypothetical protein CMT42_15265 [Elizabethkingia anophelis]|uniref:Uncharacterized protein n=1 Tax=Elizabethkingia anophelis TaxID=1117645 RepID=A0A494J280_9FLAO|nr:MULTISPECIES: hypothetical protein [Elizabethkingia]AQX52563.1 hypothetical protein AYC66_18575 [Elizabethkingia anophelis]EJK5330514.1 hypothetical protein [Elizabethkingia meningoseptica]MDV3917923.1 hypothetical protein [Elizabethkingia anophelis]MDV3920634.1 hypothetical protein [Elizabethkingia anophelis]MDV3934997.1 hypothetical protein [Elizabethkingia anophelis]
MENAKKEVITIKGMSVKFGVSIMTIYRKYLPNLEPLFKEKTVIYYDWQKAKELHESFNSKLKNFKVIA